MNQKRINQEKISVRSGESGSNIIEGYASVFNKRSKLIAEDGKIFYEVINPHAFDEALEREDLNVIANFQHNKSKMLARSTSGTLALSVDGYGLKYIFQAPNTSLGRDVVEWVSRGDVYESSFQFSFKERNVSWSRAEDGIPIREILKVERIMDVALVIDGAYSGTDVIVRELAEFEEREKLELEASIQARREQLNNYYENIKKDFYGFE